MTDVSILDYNMGNILSVKKAVEKLGYSCNLVSTPPEILKANKIILPGVGHFKKAMLHIKNFGLDKALNQKVIDQKTPILGICLGMQLMCKYSEEGNTAGLGWFDSKVVKFKFKDQLRYKTPHIGWNQVYFDNPNQLENSIVKECEFYFVHEYYIHDAKEREILTTTKYEKKFVSGLFRDNIFGVQFHPEKSHQVGQLLIKNFLEI